MNLDDAAFYFGKKQEWSVKVGRYEAYDMFTLGQVTFIEYSGNTANDIYEDGFGYIYTMKFEVNALVNNGEKMFNKSTYHGYDIEKKKNVVYVRPVLSWKNDNFSIAIAAEMNVVKNSYGYYDSDGKFRDQSQRTGYSVTFSWNSEGDWREDNKGLQINTSFAYMNAKDEKDMTIGIDIIWEKVGLGYYYADDNIKKFNPENKIKDGHINSKGKYKIHTVNAFYLIDNVLDMDNFNIYLRSYWSLLDRSKAHGDNTDDRYGARVRFNYCY